MPLVHFVGWTVDGQAFFFSPPLGFRVWPSSQSLSWRLMPKQDLLLMKLFHRFEQWLLLVVRIKRLKGWLFWTSVFFLNFINQSVPWFSSSCTKRQICNHIEQRERTFFSRGGSAKIHCQSLKTLFWVLIFPCGPCYIDQGGPKLMVACCHHPSTRRKGVCYHTQHNVFLEMVSRELR